MSQLTKKQIREWKKKLREGVYFMVGVEIKNRRKAAFINICRFCNGTVPSEKHMMHQGHLVGQLFFAEFMKCCADTCLLDAPEEIVEDLATDGILYNFIADLFIHAYFKLEYGAIKKTIEHWDEWKGVLDAVSESQQVEVVEDDNGEVV